MQTPTRILHVFGKLDCGGAETMIMNLYRNIDRSLIQFDFIVHSQQEGYYENEIKELGGKIFRVPRYNGLNLYQYYRQWTKFFAENPEYRVIHSHVRSTAAIFLYIARRKGIITISHSHSTSSGKGLKAVVKSIQQYPLRFICDYYFACSKEAGRWLYGEKVLQSENFLILNNAIDAKKFTYSVNTRDKIRKEFNLKDEFVIGHIGRFEYEKNHRFLIDIFKEIVSIEPNSKLLLVGDGILRNEIENQIKLYGIENKVILVGIRSDISQILQGMDVFVFPSHFEGLGIVAIEAQAAGLKTICANTIPKEAYITENFLYIDLRESHKKWAQKILKYNDRYERYNMYNEIYKAGYDIHQNVEYIQEFYLKQCLKLHQ